MLKHHSQILILPEKHSRSRKHFQISKTKNYQQRKQTEVKAEHDYKGSIKKTGNCPYKYGKLCQFHERLKLPYY